MNKIYFTPGPSQLFYTVAEHTKHAFRKGVCSISHRSTDFKKIYQHTDEQLRELLRLPDNFHVLFTSSATEVWERMIQNCVEQRSLHFINGAFSDKFYQTSKQLGKDAIGVRATDGEAISVKESEVQEGVELVGLVHNETSTGVTQPMHDIADARHIYPDALIALDVVSSIPDMQLDYDQVDMVYFSVQKCLGLPAGLGVWLVDDRALEKAQYLETLGKVKQAKYRQLPHMAAQAKEYQTTSTPNVLDIYLLGKVAEDMNSKGIDMIRRETKYKSAVLYHCLDQHNELDSFVKNTEYQSNTTIVATTNQVSSSYIERLEKLGLVIGSGYGKYKNEHIRIANFPAHSKEQIELLVDQINKL